MEDVFVEGHGAAAFVTEGGHQVMDIPGNRGLPDQFAAVFSLGKMHIGVVLNRGLEGLIAADAQAEA